MATEGELDDVVENIMEMVDQAGAPLPLDQWVELLNGLDFQVSTRRDAAHADQALRAKEG